MPQVCNISIVAVEISLDTSVRHRGKWRRFYVDTVLYEVERSEQA